MGADKSKQKYIPLPPSSKKVEDVQKELFQRIKDVERTLTDDPTLPSEARKKICGLLEQLQKDVKRADPRRPLVVYVLGYSNAGKSSLINALLNNDECVVGDNGKPTTPSFEVKHIARAATIFVDSQCKVLFFSIRLQSACANVVRPSSPDLAYF